MRAFDQGASVRVCASAGDVWKFRQSWPCSGLPDQALSFTFDKRNGDLEDVHPDADSTPQDALSALADDCKAYAQKRGLL